MIDKLLEALSRSERPLILIGAGAREAAPEIIAFAECWQIPIETTWNAIDLVPFEHPLFIGRPRSVAPRGANMAVYQCDLLLCIGARLDVGTVCWDYKQFAPHAARFVVDIDQSELDKLPDGYNTICMDAGEFIKELEVHDPDLSGDFFSSRRACRAMAAYNKEFRLESDTTTYQLCDLLSDELSADDVLVIGCSTFLVNVFCAAFRNKPGQRVILSSYGLGSMGSAIPVSIGVALSSGRRVVCVDGDGSFMQNTQELEVVRRLNLPIIFIVLDNQGYASIRNSETRAFGRAVNVETLPGIEGIAEAYGIHYQQQERVYFVHSDHPQIIRMITPPDEILAPRVLADGRGNMGNMFPYPEK
jgi:acetolactate synthase I/II/III large subunit